MVSSDPPPPGKPPLPWRTRLLMGAVSILHSASLRPDGTVNRFLLSLFDRTVPPSLAPDVAGVSSSDHTVSEHLRVRLFFPAAAEGGSQLPVVVYFHGGGFVFHSVATAQFDALCRRLASSIPAVVASVDYRLAPEHRLPAAYDDAVAAVLWLRDAAPADPWIAAHGDLSRCFVMGSSSGGNLAFNAGIRTKGVDLSPAAVRGLLLHQPYFGGVERTPSEAASEDDFMVPLEANDKLMSLALPVGADRDHEFSNPAKAIAPGAVVGLPRCLVSGSNGDPLFDRQKGFAAWLQDSGVDVIAKMEGSGFHAAELFVPEKADELFAAVREFVYGASDA